MYCPKCNHQNTFVIDSRVHQEGQAIRRRRECDKCGERFTTFEKIESKNLMVIKKDGTRQSYNRDKLKEGIWRACEKRKITEQEVMSMISGLEDKWYTAGKEVSSSQIGEDTMEALKELDEVAYIRFASVYREFENVETFKKELQELLKN